MELSRQFLDLQLIVESLPTSAVDESLVGFLNLLELGLSLLLEGFILDLVGMCL
jgi:hypothetical protein